MLLDAGANVECRPEHLVQFAVMGHVYTKAVLGIDNPRVGLMSIGEEDVKGNELTREANRVLKESRFINFIGNVEGRHVFNGTADVIVTDGFTGNVALKVSEAVADAMAVMIRQEMSRTVFSRLGALGSWQALARFKKRIDYGSTGGLRSSVSMRWRLFATGEARRRRSRTRSALRMISSVAAANEKINEGIRELSSVRQQMRAV